MRKKPVFLLLRIPDMAQDHPANTERKLLGIRIIQQRNTKFVDHPLYPWKLKSRTGKWVAHQTWKSNSDTALNVRKRISTTGMSPPGKRNQTIMSFHLDDQQQYKTRKKDPRLAFYPQGQYI